MQTDKTILIYQLRDMILDFCEDNRLHYRYLDMALGEVRQSLFNETLSTRQLIKFDEKLVETARKVLGGKDSCAEKDFSIRNRVCNDISENLLNIAGTSIKEKIKRKDFIKVLDFLENYETTPCLKKEIEEANKGKKQITLLPPEIKGFENTLLKTVSKLMRNNCKPELIELVRGDIFGQLERYFGACKAEEIKRKDFNSVIAFIKNYTLPIYVQEQIRVHT